MRGGVPLVEATWKPERKFHVRGKFHLTRAGWVSAPSPLASSESHTQSAVVARTAAELSRQMDTLDKRFLKAAQAGDLNEAKRLLVESPAVVHARSTSKGYTALHFAAMGGAIPVVEWLLEQGFDVEEPSRATATAPGGVTPLAVALEYKRFTTVRRLQQLRNGEARPHVDPAVLAAAGPTSHSSRPLFAAPQLATARHTSPQPRPNSPQLATAHHSSPQPRPSSPQLAPAHLSSPQLAPAWPHRAPGTQAPARRPNCRPGRPPPQKSTCWPGASLWARGGVPSPRGCPSAATLLHGLRSGASFRKSKSPIRCS